MKLGFIIANQHQEFLAQLITEPSHQFIGWSLTPEFSLVFPTRKKALSASRSLDSIKYKLFVLEVFETESGFFIGCQSSKKPDWF